MEAEHSSTHPLLLCPSHIPGSRLEHCFNPGRIREGGIRPGLLGAEAPLHNHSWFVGLTLYFVFFLTPSTHPHICPSFPLKWCWMVNDLVPWLDDPHSDSTRESEWGMPWLRVALNQEIQTPPSQKGIWCFLTHLTLLSLFHLSLRPVHERPYTPAEHHVNTSFTLTLLCWAAPK